MRAVQKQMLLMPQKEGLEMIDAQQKQMRLQIEHELKGLQQLHSTVLLEPADIHRLAALQTELRMQLLQCELFRQELQQLVQPHLQKRWYGDYLLGAFPSLTSLHLASPRSSFSSNPSRL